MIKDSVVGKLWLAIVLVVAIILLIWGLLFSRLFSEFYYGIQAQKLVREGQVLGELVISGRDGQQLMEDLSLLERFLDASIMVVDREGLVRGCSPGMGMHFGMHGDLTGLEGVLAGKTLIHRGHHHGFGSAMLSVAVPIFFDNEVQGAVLLHAPLAPITATLGAVRRLMAAGIVGAVLVATVLSAFLSRTLSLPLVQMNRVARAMAQGDFKSQVTVKTTDEVGRLGETLNYLSGQLNQSLQNLSEEKEQLQNILTSMTDGVITFDPQGKVLLANPATRQLLGTQPLPQKKLAEWGLQTLQQLFQAVLDTGEGQSGLLALEGREVAVRLAPLRSEGEVVRGVVALFQDVTKEQELERLRREFVANVSHELRTPLSFLQGYSEALLDGLAADPHQEKRYLEIIWEETLRLRRLVDDLLDLAQLEAGGLQLELEQVDLEALVDRVVAKFQPIGTGNEVQISASFPTGLPPVWGNADRLEQVFWNLLDNALRYTNPGGKVTVRGLSRQGKVEVRVEDNGSGISRDEQTRIWERFYKVDKARIRTTGGIGLGLAIVASIIKAHQGEIRVESQPGAGTTFIILLSPVL